MYILQASGPMHVHALHYDSPFNRVTYKQTWLSSVIASVLVLPNITTNLNAIQNTEI